MRKCVIVDIVEYRMKQNHIGQIKRTKTLKDTSKQIK